MSPDDRDDWRPWGWDLLLPVLALAVIVGLALLLDPALLSP